jgi:hypothetical protein
MSKPHRPRPVLVNFPELPVSTILQAAKLYDAAHDSPESHGLLAWAEESLDAWFQGRIIGLPMLEEKAWDLVHDLALKRMAAIPTEDIVRTLDIRAAGKPSGIRGALSRLVDKGVLCRVAEGYYWPANIAYDKKGNAPA